VLHRELLSSPSAIRLLLLTCICCCAQEGPQGSRRPMVPCLNPQALQRLRPYIPSARRRPCQRPVSSRLLDCSEPPKQRYSFCAKLSSHCYPRVRTDWLNTLTPAASQRRGDAARLHAQRRPPLCTALSLVPTFPRQLLSLRTRPAVALEQSAHIRRRL
jgi:hypothetical protein